MTQRVSFWGTPRAMGAGLLAQRHLIWQLTKREVAARYRGSMLGLLWAFLQPLIMLAVYSFVFSVVFRARWPELIDPGAEGANLAFAAVLLAGLVVHGFIADCLTRAPQLVIGNPNYVKKLIFPLEILPWTVIGSALIHSLISTGLLVVFAAIVLGKVYWTVILLPVIFAPYVILSVGLIWGIASIGVFVRDIGQVIGVLVTVMLFVSTIFFPADRVPELVRPVIYLNPISFIVDQVRAVVFWGQLPDWLGLGVYLLIALAVAWLGYYVFSRLRRAFADVL